MALLIDAIHYSGLYRLNQCTNPEDRYGALQIIGENMQAHFCADMFQRSHLKVGMPHPGL
jgi:hypothetical protein